MLKRFFFIPLFVGIATVAVAAHITGTFKNAAPGDRVELFVPHYYVDGRSSHFWAELDGQLSFVMEAQLPEAQLAFLKYNEDRLPIFLEPDDTLGIRADIFQFPVVVAFSGRGSANNRLLQQYFKINPPDYDELNNIRFKIGQWWAVVEQVMNERMEALAPTDFKDFLDKRREAASALLDDFSAKHPNTLTPAFFDWMAADITYDWAYHLLFYGQVYANRYQIQPPFFDFLDEAPIISEAIGNDWYRHFLQVLVARQVAKTGQLENFYARQYELAGQMLSGKSLAFFHSEMIRMAFTGERYREILPYYTQFLQTNEYPAYDAKITGLYEKIARVSPGTLAPPFTGNDSDGRAVRLAQFRGRVVYLNFWASWCSACLKKMEMFDNYAAELNSRGIEIVNVSIDENPANWRASLTARGFKGYHVLASSGYDRNIALTYGVETVPQYFIITKNGSFADKPTGNQPEDIKQQLLQIAAKSY
ncbi:MAG: TlpA family protein disulfide reductase [Saprospiraceae bacterium]|nr:TlpA family protein disulfide reductase [Saprospiraceae bacterium]